MEIPSPFQRRSSDPRIYSALNLNVELKVLYTNDKKICDFLSEVVNTQVACLQWLESQDEIGAFLLATLSEGKVVREFEKIHKKKVSG